MFQRRIVTLALSALLIIAALPTTFAQDDGLTIITSNTILADVTSNVAGDVATVTALMPLYADPHSFTPTPQDLVTLIEADMVLVIGAGLEENLDVALEDLGPDIAPVTVSQCVPILPFEMTAHDEHDEDEHDEHDEHDAEHSDIAELCADHHTELETMMDHHEDDHADHAEDEHGHGASMGMLYTLACAGHDDGEDMHEDEGEHAHEEGSCDPHVWTDPHNVMLWTLMIRDTLSAADPANADVYAANAAAYLDALQSLVEDEVEPQLATIPAENRKLVTNHLAFGYYAAAFDLEMLGAIIPSGSTLAEPSAAEIAALINAIREEGIPAVFAETTANPTLAEQVAAETGISFYALYTGSLSEPDGPAGTYLDYIRHNTEVITTALGGTRD